MPPRTAFHFVVCRPVSNAKEKWGFWFQEERLAIWPRLPVVLESGRYRPFNFDNLAKQRNLNDKGQALKRLAMRSVGSACPRLVGRRRPDWRELGIKTRGE